MSTQGGSGFQRVGELARVGGVRTGGGEEDQAQVTLGILTLLNAVPLVLAVAHQAGAMVLIGAVVVVLHRVRAPAQA